MPQRVGPRAATRAGEQRRATILEAALACFDRNGVTATTIEDIRLESGASIGSIYHHLGGKDDIVSMLYVEAVGAYREGMLAALRSHPSRPAALRAAVGFHVDWIDNHRPLARMTLRWDGSELSPSGRPRLASEVRRFNHELEAWHREGVANGTLRPLPPEVFAAHLLGPLLEYARRLTGGPLTAAPEEAEVTLSDGLCRVLLEPGAG